VRLLFPLQFLAAVVVTLITSLATVLLTLADRPRAAYDWVRWWCRVLQRVTGLRYTVAGLENVPADSPCVVISNHCSYIDGPALVLAMPHPVCFVIKKELLRIPLWGAIAVRVGFIPIDRSDAIGASRRLGRAVEAIRAGRTIALFPEGTCSPGDDMLPFKKGGFHLAVEAQVPILPVAINGSRDVWPRGTLSPRPGSFEIVIGQPIPTAGLGKAQVSALVAEARRVITEMRLSRPSSEASTLL
jgi:1-acyl-sn-glycerol-3-phosphate acyltransferase